MPTCLLEELFVYPPTWLKLIEERNNDAQGFSPVSLKSIMRFLYLEMHFLSYSLVIFERLFSIFIGFIFHSEKWRWFPQYHSIIKRYFSNYLEPKFIA